MENDEVKKLNKHLVLLKGEYVKLQTKHDELSRKYNLLSAASKASGTSSFASNILEFVSGLYDNVLYSDMKIIIADRSLFGHKFVLDARSDKWGTDGAHSELSVGEDVSLEVGTALFKWVYADHVDLNRDSDFLLSLLKLAARYELMPLMFSCENALTAHVTVKNSVKFYQTAYSIHADTLKEHCSDIISNNWDDFTSEDFEGMPAPLLYEMFKAKSNFPLHQAIKIYREDVVFLYIVDNNLQLETKLNERNEQGILPLQLALSLKQKSIAENLVKNKANINVVNHLGESLLHQAIEKADEFSAGFLIENGINVNQTTYELSNTALHQLCGSKFSDSQKTLIATKLVQHHADVNIRDTSGRTPLHMSINTSCMPVFSTLLQSATIDVNILTSEGQSPLALSLLAADGSTSMASSLINCGSKINITNPYTGEPLLHQLANTGKEKNALFFASQNGLDLNLTNREGETALHVASKLGNLDLVKQLLKSGANPNLQTSTNAADKRKPIVKSDLPKAVVTSRQTNNSLTQEYNPFNDIQEERDYNPFIENNLPDNDEKDELQISSPTDTEVKDAENKDSLEAAVEESDVTMQTALHMAIANKHELVVQAFMDYRNSLLKFKEANQVMPNFSLKDSLEQTPLAVSLWAGLHHFAKLLLSGGCSVNEINSKGLSLLHQAIKRKDTPSCLFLLENNVDIKRRTNKNETVMELSIRQHLSGVVSSLCQHKELINEPNSEKNPPLWHALELEDYKISDILVCTLSTWLVWYFG